MIRLFRNDRKKKELVVNQNELLKNYKDYIDTLESEVKRLKEELAVLRKKHLSLKLKCDSLKKGLLSKTDLKKMTNPMIEFLIEKGILAYTDKHIPRD